MERKTKHRILGILVVIGLVIILLPLFQSEKETPAEPTLVQAPPFPEQPAQASAAPASESSQMQTPQSQDVTPPQNPSIQNPSQDNGMSPQPDDTVNPDSAAQNPDQQNATPAPITNEPAKQNTTPETPSLPTPDTSSNDTKNDVKNAVSDNDSAKQAPQPEPGDVVSGSNDSTDLSKQSSATIYRNSDSDTLESKAKEAAERVMMTSAGLPEDKPTAKVTHRVKTANAKKSSHKLFVQSKSKKHDASLAQSPLEDDGLFKLKSSVWVIQMGSFKNKSNAIRLVNNLRSKGYPAFIQQIASSTRVFVGPSAKQTVARTLASRIKSETQMEGIVISYKPLSI